MKEQGGLRQKWNQRCFKLNRSFIEFFKTNVAAYIWESNFLFHRGRNTPQGLNTARSIFQHSCERKQNCLGRQCSCILCSCSKANQILINFFFTFSEIYGYTPQTQVVLTFTSALIVSTFYGSKVAQIMPLFLKIGYNIHVNF